MTLASFGKSSGSESSLKNPLFKHLQQLMGCRILMGEGLRLRQRSGQHSAACSFYLHQCCIQTLLPCFYAKHQETVLIKSFGWSPKAALRSYIVWRQKNCQLLSPPSVLHFFCTQYNTLNFNKDNIPFQCVCGPQIMKNIDLKHP